MTIDYPNDGESLGVYDLEPDKKQDQSARKELAKIGASLPVIEDTIEWFDKQIAWSTSNQRLVPDSSVPVESQLIAFQELERLLTEKKNEYLTKYNAYKSEREAKRGA